MSDVFSFGTTATRSVTNTTASVALGNKPGGKGGCSVRIACPAGGNVAFIKFGDSTVTATTDDLPILPGTVEVFTIGDQHTHVAAITASGSSTIYATVGQGA